MSIWSKKPYTNELDLPELLELPLTMEQVVERTESYLGDCIAEIKSGERKVKIAELIQLGELYLKIESFKDKGEKKTNIDVGRQPDPAALAWVKQAQEMTSSQEMVSSKTWIVNKLC